MQNGLYYCRIKWYNEYQNEEKVINTFIIAESYSDAVAKACEDFDYIISIKIEEVIVPGYADVNMIYVPDDKKIIDAIKAENDY